MLVWHWLRAGPGQALWCTTRSWNFGLLACLLSCVLTCAAESDQREQRASLGLPLLTSPAAHSPCGSQRPGSTLCFALASTCLRLHSSSKQGRLRVQVHQICHPVCSLYTKSFCFQLLSLLPAAGPCSIVALPSKPIPQSVVQGRTP